jgi:prolipoprotein diacylglyceryltransferase
MYILLTPWSRVPFQNLTLPWLVTKFRAFYGLHRFITTFTRTSLGQIFNSLDPMRLFLCMPWLLESLTAAKCTCFSIHF